MRDDTKMQLMWTQGHGPSPEELQELGRRTMASLEARRQWLAFWNRRRAALQNTIQRFVELVNEVDPSGFTENHFVLVDRTLSEMIEALERHLAGNVESHDTAQCQVFGDAIRQLREARHWIVQGCSPDPRKRPTQEGLDHLTRERAQEAFKSLIGA